MGVPNCATQSSVQPPVPFEDVGACPFEGSLFLLTYQGEGETKAWFNGRLYQYVDGTAFFNLDCAEIPSRCTGQIVKESQTVW